MSTIKKTSSIIVSAVIIAGIAFGLVDYLKPDQNEILHQFTLDAVYLKNDQIVKISFEDKSNNTKSAVLEILGMDVTYHKEYTFDNESIFVETMFLDEIPKYGWKTTPVVLDIQHSEFGKIALKTEIHETETDVPKIIIEQR